MPKADIVKPSHKAIKQYYGALQSYRDHRVTREGALETPFHHALEKLQLDFM